MKNVCLECGSEELEKVPGHSGASMCTRCMAIFKIQKGRIRSCWDCRKKYITFNFENRCAECEKKYQRSDASAGTGCTRCGKHVVRTNGYRGQCICDECAH